MEFPKINVSSKADIQYITQIWRKALYDKLEQKHGSNKADPRIMQEVNTLLDQVNNPNHRLASIREYQESEKKVGSRRVKKTEGQ
jgi:hypothetical protein